MKDRLCYAPQQKKPLCFQAVTWEKLPEIDLYMDQLLAYLDRSLSPCWKKDQFKLTASMVNNYVKNQVVPRPIKKLYGRSHIAYLMIVLTLKTIYNLEEIKEVLQPFYEQEDELPAFFDWFTARLSWQLEISQSGKFGDEKQEELNVSPLRWKDKEPIAWPSLQICIEQGIAAYVARQMGLYFLQQSQIEMAGEFFQDVLSEGQF